jgi:hypothetical protein
VTNGEFTDNADGWTFIGAGGWVSSCGWDGKPGCLWLNDNPGVVEANQLITGLDVGQNYTVAGHFTTRQLWFPGSSPSFEIRMDDDLYFTAGQFQPALNWPSFTFDYIAQDSDVLLRFRSQVGTDSDYAIDGISMTPEPSAALLLFAGFGLSQRKRRSP